MKKSEIRTAFKNKDWRALRRGAGLNQHDFWTAVGVTQSGGSRYESGRACPDAVQQLVRLIYVEGIDIRRLTRADVTTSALWVGEEAA